MDEIGGDPGATSLAGGFLRLLDRGDHFLARVWTKLALPGDALTARGLLLALIGLILLLVLPPLLYWMAYRLRSLRANFRGEAIPRSFGLVLLFWSAPMLALAAWLFPEVRPAFLLWLTAILGFGGLGYLDDTWGDKQTKGLRGHFTAAWRERKFTTGFLKAVGGALLALWLGHTLFPNSFPHVLLAAALIALSANAINLLDLRPGRASAVFLVIGLIHMAFWQNVGAPLVYVLIPAFVVWARDSRAQVMLGDTGSNLLGACLGLALAAPPTPTMVSLAALIVLVALHVLAERVSITALIEKNPALRALDRLTGVR